MTFSATATLRSHPRPGDAVAALLATLVFVGLNAASGFAALTNAAGDNDSLLRLVEIRDLISGQGWFDLHQYRLGPDGGIVMHWSRLVDAPIAALVLAGSALTGSVAWGETIALVLWPAMLFWAALFFLLRASRRFAGDSAMFPALLIGATALHYTGIFAPGALDHHNVQLVLTLAMVSLLLDASLRDSAPTGAAAGACAALLLAIAMEAVPYIAAGGVVVALWFLFDPASARRSAIGFGLAFGGVATAVFCATVPYMSWHGAQCDAYSLPQFSVAALSGLGLAAVAANARLQQGFAVRALALSGLAAVLAVFVMVYFPQCLGDPYAGLDPRIKAWWLDAVTEAQPLWKVLPLHPAMAAGHYATPLLGLLSIAVAIRRFGPGRGTALIAAFLGSAFLVSIWQVRGSMFSIPLAVIPLSAFVADWRLRASGGASATATLKMLAAWLLSFNVVWSAATGAVVGMRSPNASAAAGAVLPDPCQDAAAFTALAALPATTVLIVSNLGAPVLRHTPHRVLAGPYHRNVEGNLAALDAFTGSAAVARAVVDRHGVTLIALCPGNDESRVFAERAPRGFLAMLMRGEVPAWLQPLPQGGKSSVQLFRVLRRS
jgi:hypothetical protein